MTLTSFLTSEKIVKKKIIYVCKILHVKPVERSHWPDVLREGKCVLGTTPVKIDRRRSFDVRLLLLNHGLVIMYIIIIPAPIDEQYRTIRGGKSASVCPMCRFISQLPFYSILFGVCNLGFCTAPHHTAADHHRI